MWNEIISMAMNNGLWAVLFCLLFLYELKDSRKREHKYQETVARLTESMELIRDVKDECCEIKQEIHSLKPLPVSSRTKTKPPVTAVACEV